MKGRFRILLICGVAVLLAGQARAQGTFDSGSNGSDGALTFAANAGTINFDPSTHVPRLDPDGDHVFHFTKITIPAGTTVRLRTNVFDEGKPIHWLASEAVSISGTLDLNGDSGSGSSPTVPALAGAGGYEGGAGGSAAAAATAGNGPGGGLTDTNLRHGGHASHVVSAPRADSESASSGATYGNVYVRPVVGGSGGGGGRFESGTNGGGGGGGGGAIVIASSTSIKIDGAIRAEGGNGNHAGLRWGGGGSGGAVRLIAPVLEGSGSVNVSGGLNFNGAAPASAGRVRFECFKTPTTSTLPTALGTLTKAAPSAVFLPATAPLVKVVRVAGASVAASPTGSFQLPDVVINAAGSVPVELETTNVPAGTILQLTFQPEGSTQTQATSSPVVISGGVGTATATASFQAGYTRIFVRASWTP